MVCMKMLSLAVLAGAKGVSPTVKSARRVRLRDRIKVLHGGASTGRRLAA